MLNSTRKLQHRLVAYVTLGLLIFSVCMGILTYQYAYRRQLKASDTLQNQIVQTIQSQAEVAAFVSNEEIGREILNGLLTSPIIMGVKLESADMFKLEQANEPDVDFTKGTSYPLFSPVDGKEKIGLLTVVLNNKHIRSEASQVSMGQTFLMLSQIIIATILIVWVSRRVMSQPISDLANRVTVIKPGSNSHLDIKQIHLHDEIGLLSNSINSLIDAAEAALEESSAARLAAESATKSKSEFLANMSHEIRTPMNAIMGFSALLLKTDPSSKQMEYISKIQASSKTLLGVINDILDFSKIEAGKLHIESIPFRLDEVMSNTTSMVAIKAAEKGIELISSLSGDIPVSLVGDPLRLGQILINLSNNAVKFTYAGHILVKAELIGYVKTSDKMERTTNSAVSRCLIKFSVSDTGIGMTEEQISKLFHAFSQGDTSVTRKFGGTGLGLTISKRLAHIMGGEISVESKPEVGSTFSLTCPFIVNDRISERNSIIVPEDLSNLRVLIVDDNDMSREVLTEQLKILGFSSVQVDSGKAALKELLERGNRNPYDLVLVDWKMPEMDGIELSRRIRKNTDLEKIPLIIMVTAFGREEIMKMAEEVGISAFLIKPVVPALMFNAIMEVFDREQANQFSSMQMTPEHLASEIKGARILLAEDNLINQQVAMEILQSAGINVDVAKDGLEAVRKIEKESYDLLLMDIQMPVMGGYEATGIIRRDERFKNLPIVAMTAHAMSGSKEACLDAGMNDYVAKPIDQSELFAVLTKWIKPGLSQKKSADKKEPDSKKTRNFAVYNSTMQIYDEPRVRTSKTNNSDLVDIPSNLPGIDIDSALKRLNGNRKLYSQLLMDFANTYASSVQNIREMIEREEFEPAERLAHTIKGVGGNLSAEKIHSAAKELEYGIGKKEGNYEQMLSDLQTAMDPLVDALHNHMTERKGPETETQAELDPEKVAPAIEELAGFLKANDANALTSIEELKELMDGSGLESSIVKLETNIENFDFASAIHTLNEIAEKLEISLS